MRALSFRIILFGVFLSAAVYSGPLLDAAGLARYPESRDTGRAVLESLAWLSGAFVAIAAINRFFWDGAVARFSGREVPELLKRVFALLVVGLAITGIIGVVFGLDVTGIWATSGVIGIVLGFALRSMIQDLFTGIALNLDGSIKAGDWICLHHRDFIGEHYGKVLDIRWRTSRIQLENNNIMVVPNGLMGTMAVTNFAHADHTSRLETEIVIDFDVAPERARRILLAGARAAIGATGILEEPAPQVVVGEPDERGVRYKVRFWGKVSERSPSSMQDAVMTCLLKHLRLAGLTPAYPKEDVFHAPLPKRLLDHDDTADRIEVLSRVDLFTGSLERGELETLSAEVCCRTFEAGEALVRQGEPGSSMFVVVEGMLDVLVARGNGSTGAAESVRVARLGPGEIFGEMSLLTGEARSATVRSATGVAVYEVLHEHFESLLAGRPGIAEPIANLVADRRTRNDAALAAAEEVERERERQRLVRQILTKMKAMFARILAPKGKAARAETAEA